MKKIIFFLFIALILTTSCTLIKNKQVNQSPEGSTEEKISYKTATISTNLGNIVIELNSTKAPKTVENFAKLSNSGFYDGTKIHYILKNNYIQAGYPNSKNSNKAMWGFGGPGYIIDDEINDDKLVWGSVAMVNIGPNTNGSRFMIVTAENLTSNDGKNTNFGKIVSGKEIIERINQSKTDALSRPLDDIIIQTISVK